MKILKRLFRNRRKKGDIVYKCEVCGKPFDKPFVRTNWKEEVLCHECFTNYIEGNTGSSEASDTAIDV